MATPFNKYLEVKDNYCLAYFGKDVQTLKEIINARNSIEKELKGLKVFVACDDSLRSIVNGKRNIILKSKLADFSGKMACFRNLEKKEDLYSFLKESNIEMSVYIS